jgi:hypothetical protein
MNKDKLNIWGAAYILFRYVGCDEIAPIIWDMEIVRVGCALHNIHINLMRCTIYLLTINK